MRPTPRRLGAATIGLLALALGTPTATAATPAPGAAAEAYGLWVKAKLVQGNIPVSQGPLARSSQEYPPQHQDPDEAEVLSTGQIPSGGTLVENIGVLQTIALADPAPGAFSGAIAEDVELLNQGGTPLITIASLVTTATADCDTAPSAQTQLVDIKVAGQTDPIPDPAPNTDLLPQVFGPLGLKVILNEQHKAADGRGIVVNAVHIYEAPGGLVPGLFRGDIIVGHAMSTVACPNGAPTTGTGNPIFITKDVDKATAKPGDTLTYTASVTNTANVACDVHRFVDHLPAAFEYVSTSGAFGTTATTAARPGGGDDIVIEPTGVTIATGATATQTFVVKVRADAASGTYYNNVELLCGGLGNWVKGLDAPVRVGTDVAPPPPAKKPQCDDGKDNDGDGKIDFPADPGCTSKLDDSEKNQLARTGGSSTAPLAAAMLLVGAFAIRRRRTV